MTLFLKKILPKSLLGRGFIILIAPILLTQIVSHFVFIDRHLDSITKLLSTNIVSIANTLSYLYDQPVVERNLAHKLASEYFDVNLQFFPKKHLVKNRKNPKTWAESFLVKDLDTHLPYPYALQFTGENLLLDIQIPQGVLKLKLLRKRLLSKTTQLVFIWAIGISILSFILALLFLRNQIKPLKRLANLTKSFGKGESIPVLHPSGAQEIRQLTQNFNVMQQRISRQRRQRAEMLAGISHDLRTPLTRMQLELALLSQNKTTQALQEDIEEMERLIGEYLEFVKTNIYEKRQPVDLVSLVKGIIEKFTQQGSFIIRSDLPKKTILLNLQTHSIQRSLTNILSNAQRYAQEAQISIIEVEDHIKILIDDNGPGIPEASRQDVFRPFFRLETSRNLKTGGVGLGLTITQDIIHTHGGKIMLDSSSMGGLRVIIRIPK